MHKLVVIKWIYIKMHGEMVKITISYCALNFIFHNFDQQVHTNIIWFTTILKKKNTYLFRTLLVQHQWVHSLVLYNTIHLVTVLMFWSVAYVEEVVGFIHADGIRVANRICYTVNCSSMWIYWRYRLPQESHHIFHISNRSKHSLVLYVQHQLMYSMITDL